MASRPAGKRAAGAAVGGGGPSEPLAKRARLEHDDALSATLEATIVGAGRAAAAPAAGGRGGETQGYHLEGADADGDGDGDDDESGSIADSVASYSSMPPLVPASTFSRPHGASTDADESDEAASSANDDDDDDGVSSSSSSNAIQGAPPSHAAAAVIAIEEEEAVAAAVAPAAEEASPAAGAAGDNADSDDAATVPNSDTDSDVTVIDTGVEEDEPDDAAAAGAAAGDDDAEREHGAASAAATASSAVAATQPAAAAVFDARLVAASTELDAMDDVHLPVLVDVDDVEPEEPDEDDAAAADLDGAAVVHALLRAAGTASHELSGSDAGAAAPSRPFRLLPQAPLDAAGAAGLVLQACDSTRSQQSRRQALLSEYAPMGMRGIVAASALSLCVGIARPVSMLPCAGLLAAPTSEQAAVAMATAAADGSRYPLQPRPSAATPLWVLQQLQGFASRAPPATSASSSAAAASTSPPLASMFVMATATLLLPLDVDTATRLAPGLSPLLTAFLAGPAAFDTNWSASAGAAQAYVGVHTQPAFSLSDDDVEAVAADSDLPSSVINVVCYLALLHVFSVWQRHLTAAGPPAGSMQSALGQHATKCLDRLMAAVGPDAAGASGADIISGVPSSSSSGSSDSGGSMDCGVQDLPQPPPAAAAALSSQLRSVSDKLTAAAGALAASDDPQQLLASWARHQHGLLCAELATTAALHAECLGSSVRRDARSLAL